MMRRYLLNFVAEYATIFKGNRCKKTTSETIYIHERGNWTAFTWDATSLTALLEEVSRKQGMLYGRLSSLGFDSILKAMAENLTCDVVYSSEIEGIRLNVDEVRSSIARRLGIENVKQTVPSHYVDSVVAVMLEAMRNFNQVLTKEKLCAWQAAFFPLGFSEGARIETGTYRTNEEHIVSGMFGRERIHYIAPSPDRVEGEMQKFLDWFNTSDNVSSVTRSAIAHLWFVSIHPFKDMTLSFTEVHVEYDAGVPYLNARYKGTMPVRERILSPDAERYRKGDLPLENLLTKYCSYMNEG